ncbi:MAG: four helix bundle protein [Chloroflexi bacterium]|nr:four helix bundle protein [Chloroflexota bacterium]
MKTLSWQGQSLPRMYDYKSGTFSKDFALCDQIRRASVSIMANIAEGFERDGTRVSSLLAMAKGSSGEVTTIFIGDRNYTGTLTLAAELDEIGKMLGGLSNYLRQTPLRGTKYK